MQGQEGHGEKGKRTVELGYSKARPLPWPSPQVHDHTEDDDRAHED